MNDSIRVLSCWFVLSLGPALAQTFVPSNDVASDRELIPAALGLRTDQQGNSWNFQQNGTLGRIGNSIFNTGMSLLIDNQQFSSGTPLMTPDGREFVMSGRIPGSYGGLSVTRRVKLDEKKGVVRYLEIFQNPTASEIAIQVELRSNLGANYKSYLTDSGEPGAAVLTRDQTGIVVIPSSSNVNRAAVLTLRSPTSAVRPAITSQSRYLITTQFQLRIPPGETQCLLHTVAQVPLPAAFDRRALDAAFRPGVLHRNLATVPTALRSRLANVSLGEEARGLALLAATSIDRLGVKRGRKDILAVGEETRLVGESRCASLEIETEFGTTAIAFEDVSALVGGNRGRRGREKVFLRDGQVLGGSVAAEALQFALQSGETMDLEVAKLDRLLRSQQTGEERWPDEVIAFLETHQGDRLALLAAPESRLQLVSPWGQIEVGLDEVSALSIREDDPVGHLVELKNGSRFFAFATGEDFTFSTPRFGQHSLRPSQIRAIVSKEAASQEGASSSDVWEWESPRLTEPYLNLRGRQRLVGRILQPQLTLLTEGESVQVAPETIRYLVNESGDESESAEETGPPMFRAELWGGGVVAGNLREPVLGLRLLKAEWRIPVRDILQGVVPSPRITPETRQTIAKWIRDLGDNEWTTREMASKELAALSYLAKPQLIDASRVSEDPEVLRRVERLLIQLD